MERHKCKLCSRSFSNGRALGGHMKAHLATLPLPPKPHTLTLTHSSSSFSYSCYSSSSDSQQQLLEDKESETESSKNPTRQRSKRNRKSAMPKLSFRVSTPPHPDTEPLSSSVSDTSPEEDVAMCLMMLSRDTWKDHTNAAPSKPRRTGSSPSPSPSPDIKLRRVRAKHHHLCPNCSKTFRSSRALASHTSVCCQLNNTSKTFQCPFCYKVFGSGQALGGHKRSHLLPPTSSTLVHDSVKLKQNFIDLNLPAPAEDDDLSVVSDA